MTTITTRSGKGSPLTNDEVDDNFLGLNDDKVETSGDSMTGNLSFGDNNKAIFGAGSDLQIYHSTNSYIQDSGAGSLFLLTQGAEISLLGNTSAEYMGRFIQDGAVELYHNGNQKLATTSTGIDVTGSVTADDMVISDGSPTLTFYETDTTNLNARFDNGGGDLYIQTVHDDGSNAKTRILIDHSEGDISFYNSAGTSQDLRWDASTSRLGIGTTSPANKLTVSESSTGFAALIQNNLTSGNGLKIQAGDNTGDRILQLDDKDGNERFRVTALGNVGINTTAAPSYPLTLFDNNTDRDMDANGGGQFHIDGNGYAFGIALNAEGANIYTNSGSRDIIFGTNETERVRIDGSGRLLVGTSSVGYSGVDLTVGDTADSQNGIAIQTSTTGYGYVMFGDGTGFDAFRGQISYNHGNDYMMLQTAGSERMRIDSSGNTGFGTSAPVARVQVTGTASTNLIVQRTNAYGAYIGMTDLSGTYGYIGNNDGDMVFLTPGSGYASKLNITSAGNVEMPYGDLYVANDIGIGVVNPSFIAGSGLHIQRAGDATVRLGYTGSHALEMTCFADRFKTRTMNNRPFTWADGSDNELMRVTSAGDFLVGKTAIGSTTDGFEARASGYTALSDTSGAALNVNRNSTDGAIVTFTKDGTTVGSIGTLSGDLNIGSGDTGLDFSAGLDAIMPHNPNTNGLRDSAIDLGQPTVRFKDLHLSGDAFLERVNTDHDGDWGMEMSGVSTARIRFNSSAGGSTTVGSITVSTTATAYNQSSDERLKENIVDAPSASDDIDALQVRSFDWKINGEHQKYGMVAQELNTVAPEAVTIPDDPEEMAGVDYSKLVPMLVKEIQSLRARVAQLEGAN